MDKNAKLLIIGIFVIGFISRILFASSNVFFFDGDEAIVGLMGLDHLQGQFPLFFYGQTYGFAFLESILISVVVLLFGHSMLAIKLPMLLLWLISVALLSLTIYRISGKRILPAALFAALFLLSPTWLVWSMKARGGYITAFLTSSIIIYWIFGVKSKLQEWKWLVSGLLLWITFEAQPLWFFPLLPFVAYGIYTHASQVKVAWRPIAFVLGGSLSAFGIFKLLKAGLDSTWNTPAPKFASRLEKISEIPEVLKNTLGGNYFLSSSYEPTNGAYSSLFLIVFVLAAILILRSFLADKKKDMNQMGLVLLIATAFSFTGFLVKSEPRYLLPFFGFALMLLIVGLQVIKPSLSKGYLAAIGVVGLVGMVMLPNFKQYSFVNMKITGVDSRVENDKKVMEELIRLFEHEGVKYVYTTNEFMQYQLNFMTNGEILTMGRADRCRTPWNVPVIREAYKQHPEQFALIGYNFNYQYSGRMPLIRNKVYYVLRPNEEIMNQVGFFNDEKPLK